MTDRETRILDLFVREAGNLRTSCSELIKEHVGEDNLLFAGEFDLYTPPSRMHTRGMAATTRLLTKSSETTYFPAVVNIIKKYSTQKDNEDLKRLKTDFKMIINPAKEQLDVMWNIAHLHLDISDEERLQEQFNIFHSCMGIMYMTCFYETCIRLSELFDKFINDYVHTSLVEG